MGEIVFPIAATSDSFIARTARGMGNVMGKMLSLQLTGGSSTVPDAFGKLRVAGAVARQMLLAAAAQQTGVAVAQLKTADGHVLAPDGKRIPYTALAAAAGKLKAPSEVTLKPASEWRLLGKPLQRLDIVPKSTGTAVYGIDLRMPGMVYATVCTNPRKFADDSIRCGELLALLERHCAPADTFHLYSPHRARMPGKLRAFIDFMQQKNRERQTS